MQQSFGQGDDRQKNRVLAELTWVQTSPPGNAPRHMPRPAIPADVSPESSVLTRVHAARPFRLIRTGNWYKMDPMPEVIHPRPLQWCGSRADTPPRKVLIATTMETVVGDFEARLAQTEALIDAAAREAERAYPGRRLDLLALPEVVLRGTDRTSAQTKAVPLEGPAGALFARKARQYGTYLIGTLILREGDQASNAAVLFDRAGEVAGIYRKAHPVAPIGGRLEGGITPGREYPVFDCDFGRIGILICWDMGYEGAWDALADQGAEIVVVSSASPQTLRPMAQALRHQYYVVTATRRDNASIFNPIGQTVAQTTAEPALVHQIDLAYAVLHWSVRLQCGQALARAFGDRVGFIYSQREDTGVFWSNDPEVPIGRMVSELGLEQMPAQIERCRALREQAMQSG
jgi:predicted amidohydrolase